LEIKDGVLVISPHPDPPPFLEGANPTVGGLHSRLGEVATPSTFFFLSILLKRVARLYRVAKVGAMGMKVLSSSSEPGISVQAIAISQ
jgi:hypothetical protein